jgi:hypothetical protein
MKRLAQARMPSQKADARLSACSRQNVAGKTAAKNQQNQTRHSYGVTGSGRL